MELYYATTNTAKFYSLLNEFKETTVTLLQWPLEIPEPRSIDVQEIAVHKANYAFSKRRARIVCHDAGFYIHSLNGFPRAFVNFALETIGLEGILRLVEGKERGCEFRDCIAYRAPDLAEPKCFVSRVPGAIAPEQRGTLKNYHQSKLALVFVPEGASQTLAEMSYAEYMAWRRLSREQNSAGRQFANWLIGSQKNQ